MSEQKKPEAGEFWEWAGCRLRIIGTRSSGAIVAEHECGSLEFGCVASDMKHLPDCTGFDWQPETFPQWYVAESGENWIAHAYLKRISANVYERYRHNGEKDRNEIWDQFETGTVAAGYWKQVTQAEAEARVKKPEPPMPQETPKREYVKIWLRWGNDRLYATSTGSDDPKDRELKHDGTGFYVEDGK